MTVTSLGVYKMCIFLKSNCLALCNEDVLHSNNSFITGMLPFLDEHFMLKKVYEDYLKTKNACQYQENRTFEMITSD